jgi:lambda family phage portal protein
MSAHAAADTSDNALRAWTPRPASPDADMAGERDTMVGRSRDLIRNHGVAQGAQQTIADNVVGTGLRLGSRPMYKLLGLDKAWAREFGDTVEGYHRLWWGDTSCDACDELDGAGLTNQVVRSLFANGEACAVPMWSPEPGQLFASRLLLIEPDQLCNPNRRPNSATLRDGVERDPRTGRALAYWVRSSHPGDSYGGAGFLGVAGEWTRIEAKTRWGRRRFLHVHDKDRVGQTRGKPLMAAVMKPFKQLDHYTTVHLQTAIVNSMIAAFIKTPLDQESLIELFGGDADSARKYFDAKASADSRTKLKGGALIPLQPGDDVVPFVPANASAGFDQFVMSVYRHIAAGLNLPYELLLKDFTKTNYSSARAAMLEAWRYFNALRRKVGAMFCQPAYELILEEMVDRQMVDAPDFYNLRRAYAASRWIGPGRGWVDPVKEATAAQIRMETRQSTLEMECAEQGLDWEEVLEQQAVEHARCQELGLPSPYENGLQVTTAAASAPVTGKPEGEEPASEDPQDPKEPS